jgi:hypothetical protein
MPVDCNKCKYLSCTESEQNHLRNVFNETIPHVCIKYNKRVFHNHNAFKARTKNHNNYIYPCDECLKETKVDD